MQLTLSRPSLKRAAVTATAILTGATGITALSTSPASASSAYNAAWYSSGVVFTITHQGMLELTAGTGAAAIWLDDIPGYGKVLSKLSGTLAVGAGYFISRNDCWWIWVPYWVAGLAAISPAIAIANTNIGTYSCP